MRRVRLSTQWSRQDGTVEAPLTGLDSTFGISGGDHTDPGHAADLPPGTDVGGYRIVRLLGRGGMGLVYEALQDSPQRSVALKMFREGRLPESAARRFRHEAGLLARLRHPGIAHVYGTGVADPGGSPYLAMELVPDALPITAFAAARSLALRRRVELMVAACDATAHAHGRGVIHRDLKPGNLLVDDEGHVKVIDFGIAWLVDDGADAARDVTRSFAHAGTPQYMSPEQAAGELSRVGPASDIYSLGATLYHLLTGHPAFHQTSVDAMLEAVRKADFQPPRARLPAVPRGLDAICRRAMAPAPAERYASARALGEDLERWLADEPVSAFREPWSGRLGRFARRHRTTVWTTGLTAGVALVLIATVAIAAAVWVDGARREAVRQRLLAELRERQARAAQLLAEQEARAAQEARRSMEVQERRARAATDFLVGVFATNDPLGLRGTGLRKNTDEGRPLEPRELLQRKVERADQELAGEPLLQATLLDALGMAFLGQGDLERAATLVNRAWEARRDRLRDPHPDLLASKASRAALMIVSSQMPEAEALLREVLAAQEADSMANDSRRADTQFLLALALREQYQVDESTRLLRASLAIRDKRLGLNHPDTLLARALLVDSLASQDKQAEAMAEGMKLVSVADPRVASLLVSGLVRYQQLENLRRRRDFEAAAGISDQLRAEVDRVLGPAHPLAIALHFHHAMMWRQQGNRLEADRLTERILGQAPLAMQRLPRMAEVYCRLAESLAERGQRAAAERYFQEAFRTGGAVYVKENAWGLKAGFSHARFRRERGELAAAAAICRETLRLVPARDEQLRRDGEAMLHSILAAGQDWNEARRVSEAQHSHYWARRADNPSAAVHWARLHAACLRELADFPAALALERAAFELSRSVDLGASTPALATFQIESGDLAGGRQRAQQCLARIRAETQAGQADIAGQFLLAPALLRSLELSAEAEAPLLELQTLVETKLGSEDRLAQEVMFTLACSKLAAKDLDATTRDMAMKRVRAAFKLRQSGFGPSDPATLAMAHSLALMLSSRGERDEAEAMLRQALAAWPASVPASDSTRLAAALDLADLLLAQSKFGPAEAWLVETLETLKQAVPVERHKGSWRIAEVRSRLGAALSEQGRFAAAEPLLIDGRATLEAAWWPEHPRVRAAAERIARHQQRKNDDKASTGSR